MRFDHPQFFLGDIFTVNTPTRATLSGINGGTLGVRDTLICMRDYVRDAIRDPQQRIREMALEIVRPLPERAYGQEVAALHAWVRDNIRYVQDPEGLELVATPIKTVQYGQGDCDDKSTLLAALLTSLNHPSRFAAVGLDGNPISHVLVETRVGDRWIPLETILNVEPGWYPPNVTSKFLLKV